MLQTKQNAPARTIDHVRLDLRRVKPRESLEAARAFYSGILSVDVLDRHTIPVRNHGVSWRLGDGIVATQGTTSAGVRLSPDRSWLSNTRGEFLIVRIYRTGRCIVFDKDDIRDISSGCIYLSDRFDALCLETGDSQSLVVRADRLGRERVEPVYKAIPTISPFGRVLQSALSTLFMVLPTCSASEAAELGTVAASLLKAALDGKIDGEHMHETFAAARNRALQTFVAAHALDDRITADTLSSTFNASRATVYRAFEEFGGIHRYIAKIRLRRSFARLALAETRRGLVGNIADGCGYPDVAHFSRAFKREFGCAPSDVVGLRHHEGREASALQPQDQSSRLTPMIRLYG